MKKLLSSLIIIVAVLLAGQVWATGACVQTGNTETIRVNGEPVRKVITFTCTSDGSGIAAYTFTPATFGVRGWYLYAVSTDPDGTSAPTNSYDITFVRGGEDIAGSLLIDRSSTLTQTVAIAPTTLGYHMADGAIAFTFANITSNPGIFVMKTYWTAN